MCFLFSVNSLDLFSWEKLTQTKLSHLTKLVLNTMFRSISSFKDWSFPKLLWFYWVSISGEKIWEKSKKHIIRTLDDHLSHEHGMEKHQHRCQLCQDKAFSSIVTLKMHVLKSHEINFSKVVSDPFILKLFDIVTEPNMNFHEG